MSDRLPRTEGEKNEDRRRSTSIFKDPRIDRGVTWFVGAVVTSGIGLILNYAQGLDSKFTIYGATLNELKQDIAVLKDERREIAELKSLVNRLENRLHDLEVKK